MAIGASADGLATIAANVPFVRPFQLKAISFQDTGKLTDGVSGLLRFGHTETTSRIPIAKHNPFFWRMVAKLSIIGAILKLSVCAILTAFD
jgi:hypothetical protein